MFLQNVHVSIAVIKGKICTLIIGKLHNIYIPNRAMYVKNRISFFSLVILT